MFKKIIYIFSFIFFTGVLIFTWSEKPRYELENNIIRLHIIANSDSIQDQTLKLMIRDEITEYAKIKCTTPTPEEMEIIANSVLKNENASYTAKAVMGKYTIDRRKYEDFYLPKGIYTAARIELGEAKGKNWWCVLSPPLCFTKSAFGETDEMSEYISEDTNKIISTKNINIKFRIVEWASHISNTLGI